MFTRDEVLAVAGTRPVGGVLPLRFAGAAIDSRQVRPGDLFVALRGEQTDGHRFIANAVRAGASAVLCARPDPLARARGVPQVVVADPLAALHRLARYHLDRQPYTSVVAIAGSNGKTSVKEATAALLERIAPTLRTVGNLNTETGLPVSLLRLNPEHRYAVLEMGAQRVGEVAALCRIALPAIGVVTVVGPEHLEFFGSMENVIRAEGEVVAALPVNGLAILNADDPHVRAMARRTDARVLTYGTRGGADVRAIGIAGDPLRGLSFTLQHGEARALVRLGIPGQHAVTTALAAASVALASGMDIAAVADALGEIRPAKRRGELKPGLHGTTLVDDTYNANRQSALAAIELLRGAALTEPGAQRWFIFGDMLELGTYSAEEHAAVGTAAVGLDHLVLVGSDVAATSVAALRAGMPAERVHLYRAAFEPAALAAARAAALVYIREHVRPGDVLLVKGSNGIGMDRIVAGLLHDADG